VAEPGPLLACPGRGPSLWAESVPHSRTRLWSWPFLPRSVLALALALRLVILLVLSVPVSVVVLCPGVLASWRSLMSPGVPRRSLLAFGSLDSPRLQTATAPHMPSVNVLYLPVEGPSVERQQTPGGRRSLGVPAPVSCRNGDDNLDDDDGGSDSDDSDSNDSDDSSGDGESESESESDGDGWRSSVERFAESVDLAARLEVCFLFEVVK
jgi:hypothetical protein